MADKFEEMELGGPAMEAYWHECLEKGLTLCRCLLDEYSPGDMNCITCLPEGFDISKVKNYSWGGITKPELVVSRKGVIKDQGRTKVIIYKMAKINQAPYKWLLDKIISYMGKLKNSILACEDVLAKPDDPCLQKQIFPFYVYEREVYFIAYNQQVRDRECLGKIIKSAQSPYEFVSVISCLPAGHQEFSKNLDHQAISLIAKHARHIILGAFDMEGYIICSLK